MLGSVFFSGFVFQCFSEAIIIKIATKISHSYRHFHVLLVILLLLYYSYEVSFSTDQYQVYCFVFCLNFIYLYGKSNRIVKQSKILLP